MSLSRLSCAHKLTANADATIHLIAAQIPASTCRIDAPTIRPKARPIASSRTICRQVHLVNPKAGKMLSADEDWAASISGIGRS